MTALGRCFVRKSSFTAVWALALAALLGAACSQAPAGKSEIEVAQVAVRANPALELVATDPSQGVLTVRVRSTGQLVTVKAADVNAGTAFTSIALDGGAGAPGVTVQTPAGSVTVSGGAQGQGATAAPAGTVTVETPAGTVTASVGEAGGTTSGQATSGAPAGIGVTAQRSGADKDVRVTTPAGVVTVQRDGGSAQVTTPQATVTQSGSTSQVNVPGSGVTVTRDAGAQASTATVATGRGWVSVASPGQRLRTSAITCRQGQVETISNANFEVDDVAIVVETGCMLTVRGSRVAGGDTAIVVKMGGNLTLEGSTVEGRRVAVQFDMGSTGAVRGNTIHGRVAKANGAVVTEQGNTYK